MVEPVELTATHSSERSTRSRTRRRANRVSELEAIFLAIAAGVAAAFGGASPTGQQVIDSLLVAIAAGAVVYCAASAPWWLLAGASVVGVAVAGDSLLIALGCIGGSIALLIGWRRRDLSSLRVASAAITCNVLARASIDARFGVTAVVAVATCTVLLFAGLRRRPRSIRRIAWVVVACIGGLAVLSTASFAYEALAARSSLVDGKREAELAIDAVERGEYEIASGHFARASELLRDANRHVNRPWAWLASVVPVLAQHRSAAFELSDAGADAADAAQVAVDQVDPESLRIEGGVLDLAAIDALRDPIGTLNTTLSGFGDATRDADSRWLLPAVRDELADLSVQLDDNAARLDDVTVAVALAPQILGRDGPRVYLVLFTTPAEARGLGGFIGNYAELTIDGGRIELTDFGRASDLEARSRELGVRITGPADFLRRYGTFGYNTDGNGLVGAAPWRNLSISPDFPTVATVAAEMYPQITGRPIDGVITVDPYVIATLLGYTGPIQLETVDFTIDATNAANYLLIDQYQIAEVVNTERIDALEEVARRTIEAFLSGAMPDPTQLTQDLGPFASSRRLAVWMADPDEEDFLRRVNLDGALPALDGADGWSVTVTNAGGSKIDTFLQRDFSYDASTVDGVTTGTLRATFVNTAPTEGLPNYVIGNALGLPSGTSRLYVSFYSALELTSATVDGAEIQLAASTESEWNVYSGFVTLSSGEQNTFELSFAGAVADPGRVVTWVQPLVIPPTID